MSKRFKELSEHAPEAQDEYTCPEIDAAIEQLEGLRKSNTRLRDSLTYWESKCREVCNELDDLTKPKRKPKRKPKKKHYYHEQ